MPPVEREQPKPNHQQTPPFKAIGERELTAGMLSKNSRFRLIAHGPITVTEIDRLIAKLQLDKEILAADNDEQAE